MSESPTPEQPPPARRHWIPRGALVFLALAAALVLVFVLIRPDWLTGDSDQAPTRLRFDKTLADIGAVDGIRLSDDNATSQTVAFSLPIDARVEHPYLSLVGTTTVSDDSTIFLRVLADGQSVFVRQLSSGEDDLDEEIELPRAPPRTAPSASRSAPPAASTSAAATSPRSWVPWWSSTPARPGSTAPSPTPSAPSAMPSRSSTIR